MSQINNKKTIWAWAMYDWANSAFATTVLAGFFPIFFKQYWSVGADPNLSTARLGLANAIAGLLVAVLAPVLGAIADRGTSKKNFLFIFTVLGIITTALLYGVGKGNWPMAVVLFALANVGFLGGIIFYDALIVGVASQDRLHSISALGYAYGYLGGALLFAINVWMTLSPATFGLTDAVEAVRLSFLTVAIWWAVFGVPLFVCVAEPEVASPQRGFAMVTAGMKQFYGTFHEIRHLKSVGLFLLAYWFYIDGVGTIIRMAVDYGMSIGFESNDLITALLLTQIIGFPAAIVFGKMGNRFGARPAIGIAIGIYFLLCIGGAFMQTRMEFYLLAVGVGLAQGGIQALSRSYYAMLIPTDKSAEYFGFYNMMGKFAAVLGPMLMGGVGLLVRNLGYSSNAASRASISAVSLLFLIGGALLYFVDDRKAREEAQYL